MAFTVFSDKHLFFDLDRTLWDFDRNSETTIRQILKNENIEAQVNGFEAFHAVYVKKNANFLPGPFQRTRTPPAARAHHQQPTA